MEHIIQMEGINKYYKMGAESLHALREVNLTVERGEFLAILGPSGSGKSTLMNIVGCMDTADTGSYQLDGAEISAMKDDQLTQVRSGRTQPLGEKRTPPAGAAPGRWLTLFS